MKYDVLGLGNPLIDVIVHVDDAFLHKMELHKGSMNLVEVDLQQQILEAGKDLKQTQSLGGSCANSMVMVSQLGGKAAYCGKLGNDALGENYEAKLKEAGVSSFLQKMEGATGSTVILVTPDADRTMNTHLGMCQFFAPSDLNLGAIEEANFLYIEGYLWDTPSQKEAVLTAVKHAKKVGTKIALTLSDAFCVDRHKEEFQNLMEEYVDLLFCNELEAKAMTGETDRNQQLKVLSNSVDHIIITLGSEGAFIHNKTEHCKVNATKVDAIDTTGAGDSFAAGYLFGISKGYSIEKAGQLASFCAGLIVSQDGPRFNGDLKSKVGNLIVQQ